MSDVKVYEYAACSTCKKALKFLESRGVSYERVPIVERPPSMAELRKMLACLVKRGGSIRGLLNTSGQVYREMKLSEKLPGMSEDQILELLAKNGKLVKRPFVMSGDIGLVGFKEEEWKRAF